MRRRRVVSLTPMSATASVRRLLACAFVGLATACGASAPVGGGETTDEDAAALPEEGLVEDTSSPVDTSATDAPRVDSVAPSPDTALPATDATPPPATASISVVVLPDDGRYVVTNAIKAATKSIHVEVYLLTDTDVIDALIAAKKAGRDVGVLLEKAPYPTTTANQAAYDTLAAGGVAVSWTTGLYPLTHSKTMIVDGAKAYVMTLNLTASGLRYNREYIAVDGDPVDVAEAEAVYTADKAGTPKPKLSGGLVISPVNARGSLTGLIDAATKSIDLEFEEVTDTTIASRLGAAVARGVTVRLVVPGSPDSSTAAALPSLKSAGVQIKMLGAPDVHAKAIVVDGARVYVGSINLTRASIDNNREIGVISGNATAVSRVATTIANDFAKGTSF
jgi:cardiolipin synthase